jgi:phosphate transport system substrate-binding protein
MKTRSLFLSLLLIASFVLTACGGAAATEAPAATAAEGEPTVEVAATEAEQVTLSVSGAFALYPLMVRWAEEYQALYPNVRIDVSGGGAGKGMSDALAGAVDFGMVSREIRQEETDQGAFGIAVTRDAVFTVVNATNPYIDQILAKGLTTEALYKLYITGEFTTWGELLGDPSITDPVNVYTRSDAAGAAEMFAKFIGGEAQEDLLGIGVNADPGLLEAVLRDPLGIGYNNLNYIFDPTTGEPVTGAIAAPIDLNTDGTVGEHELLETRTEAVEAILSGDYPSPPARLLYLVSNGQPSGPALDLLLWILGDGQQYVEEAGYILLTEQELATELGKLP